MLSGRTSVFIDTTKSDDDPDQTTKTESKHDVTSSKDGGSEDLGNDCSLEKKPLDRSKYGKFIIHFDAGKSFGEIALISDDSVRNATVIADEDTDLLLVHRDLFNRSMKAQQEKAYEERKHFIDNCRLFSDWTPKFKHLLEMSIRKEVYPYGAYLMRQGKPVDGLFFIISGQAKVLTEPPKHKQQFPQLMTQMSLMEKEFGRHNKENVTRKSINSLTQRQIRVRRKEGYAAAEKRHMTKSLEVCTIETSEIQGDLEMVMELSTNSCSVMCTANSSVFILDTKNYERLVAKKNLNTILKLKEGVLKKLQSRLATTNRGRVPLFQIVHDRLQEELKPRLRETPSNKRKVDNDRNTVLTQMIKLYLKDKGPLIDPLLPDSFHARLMAEKRNKQIEKLDEKKRELASQMCQRRNRVPRSLKQLRTSAAETELLNPNRNWMEPIKPSKDRHLRPKTAIGIETRSDDGHQLENFKSDFSPIRSSGVFLTECGEAADITGEQIQKEKSVLVTEEFDHVFEQMNSLQREKTEARSKVICSVTAKRELREETDRSRLGYNADDMFDLHDEDYFDFETSATNLKSLEGRIKTFCDDVREKRHNDPVRVDEMRCFYVKSADSVPMSGGTVYVSRKRCSYPKNARLSIDVHQHVRRFIITRDSNQYMSSSSVTRRKSALALTAGPGKQRPKSAW